MDHYPTPYELVREALKAVDTRYYKEIKPDFILDPGAGTGVWGQESKKIWPDSFVDGVELDPLHNKPNEYSLWVNRNFLEPDNSITDKFRGYDLVVGNPPYKHAEQFIRESYKYLRDGGILVQLLRLAFLEGQRRAKVFWPYYKPMDVLVCARRPSYTGNGKTDATAYMVCIWKKGFAGPTWMNWLQWDYDEVVPETLSENFKVDSSPTL